MTPETTLCLFVIIALLIASMALQYVRATKRKALVREFDPDSLSAADRQKWQAVDQGFDLLFRDFRKLQIIKRNSPALRSRQREALSSYRRLSRVEISVTISLFVFAALAFRFCM
jgi:hypothetical protein